jgi:cell division protein FtsZ
MVFVTAGMGGGTGTGAAPVVARCAKEMGILTVGVVTKPFHFEGLRRMKVAEAGIQELQKVVDTLLIIPNQNLFRVANEKTTFADAFAMADQVLYSGVACVTDLMVKEGLINLDFADVRAVMREMGKAMMGTGEASGEKRALSAAEAAISNPLIDDASMKGAKGLLISITGGRDLTLYEVDEAATRIREEVDQDANIIVGATFDEQLEGIIRVAVVATGIDAQAMMIGSQQPMTPPASEIRFADTAPKLRPDQQRTAERTDRAERAERIERAIRGDVRVLPGAPTSAAAAPAAAATPIDAVESAARAAVAAAVMPTGSGEDVTIRPLPPKPSLFAEPAVSEPAPEPPAPAAFIPPAPERTARPPRMPRIDELPVPAQNELRASRGETPPPEHPEKRRLGLLQRLASVGLGRRDGEEAEAPASARPPAPPVKRVAEARPTSRAPARGAESRPPEAMSEYAKRPAHQALDPHGRQAPVHNLSDDDQLEIPAFLRRQVT